MYSTVISHVASLSLSVKMCSFLSGVHEHLTISSYLKGLCTVLEVNTFSLAHSLGYFVQESVLALESLD